MAIKYAIDKHTVAFPTKCLASNGGKHIFNIHITEDVDNGFFVGKGKYEGLDLYTEAAPTTFEGTVVDVAANGNFYVEVTSAVNALFVYTVPMIEEDYTNRFKATSNFYNGKDSVVRAYELAVGDLLEISAEGFDAVPTKDDTVELKAIVGATAKKLAKKS